MRTLALLRSLRREWQCQRRDHPRQLNTALLLWAVLSAALAGVLVQQRWQVLQQRQSRQGQTDQGLLELRVNSHKITALDWGHWDPLYAYAAGADPGFPARELDNSSIIQDGQGLMVVDAQQRVLLKRGSAVGSGVSPELSRCLQEHLQQLALRSQAGQGDRAYGFYCQTATQPVLGAGTSIRRSGGTGPERGWLLHISRIQRPSYNTAVNQAFSRINASLSSTPGQAGTAAPAVSELLPASHVLTLKPASPAWRQRITAVEGMAPGWIGVNGLVAAAAAGTLLSLRQLRQRDLQMERAKRNQLRLLRQELPGPLLSRSELLQAIQQPEGAGEGGLSELWIAALQVKVMLFREAIRQRGEAQNQALAWLGERLQQLTPTRHLALGENNTLLQVIHPSSGDARDEHRQIEHQLQELQLAMAEVMQLSVDGILTRLDRHDVTQQLADLALVLSLSESSGGIRHMPSGVADWARDLRQQQSRDFDLTRSFETLQDHRYALEPVLQQQGDAWETAYSEMLFRLPQELEGSISVQELVLALERNHNIHLLDQLMVRRAIALLGEPEGSSQQLGVNISAVSFGSEKHIKALFAQLRSLPAAVRHRLVLEVTETALVNRPELWEQRLQQLRDFGVRIAIDDFGVGYASIAYLFQFKPDFLKLDLSYSQRLHDANVDALVTFLVRYGELNHCGLILEGIETEEQLQYWQARGVRLFQGYLFRDRPRG
ncbi:EAL domain-containing protein [Synechococcus sp. HK05]|uniref:EAL domain-containing protein n=1 Tax=Synechococcus sp. HK05 TaxID=2725975 RepID=UPI001C38FD0D|nr:EAL domain-containing protein [Synechococcus sp. HK05]MBV2350407.1 EAL domain-containing protein [Synechococcus sp. HK05]